MNPLNQQILNYLAGGPRTVPDIALALSVSRDSVGDALANMPEDWLEWRGVEFRFPTKRRDKNAINFSGATEMRKFVALSPEGTALLPLRMLYVGPTEQILSKKERGRR